MFREYQDARIKRNLKIADILSFVALILFVICTVTYLFLHWLPVVWMREHPEKYASPFPRLWGMDTTMETEIGLDIIYCLIYFILALSTYLFAQNSLHKKTNKDTEDYANEPKWLAWIKDKIKKKLSVESERNNDFLTTSIYVIFNFVPVAVGVGLAFACVITAAMGTFWDIAVNVGFIAFHLGVMFLSHIFIVISSGFLIQNCVLIKREWKTNPPQFLLEEQQQAAEEQRKAEEEAQKQKAEQDTATCKTLLEECGMRFFIEYYPQLKRLPISDINVSDHYFPERQVRLTAAKKIVDLGLSECALHYIIETFGDVFSEEIIERAKNLLNEIENKNGEIK